MNMYDSWLKELGVILLKKGWTQEAIDGNFAQGSVERDFFWKVYFDVGLSPNEAWDAHLEEMDEIDREHWK